MRYEVIKEGVKNKDIPSLRNAIGGICYTSRDFSSGEFDEAIKYVENSGIKIKEDFLVGDPTISSQKSVFTDDDFAMAVFELKENFCNERIKDVKTIGKALYSSNRKTCKYKEEGCPKVQSHQEIGRRKKKKLLLVAGLIVVMILIVLILHLKQ